MIVLHQYDIRIINLMNFNIYTYSIADFYPKNPPTNTHTQLKGKK